MGNSSTSKIADIARHAGVSTATVDRVLNGRPGVNSETVQKVMQAVSALGEPTETRGRPRLREDLGAVLVVTITQRGLDVAAGRTAVPGVKRPGPGF